MQRAVTKMKQRGDICIMKERKVADDITDALFELLKTKNLVDITTTEIIKKAGVCRSSFYRNFYLPEDVIRQYGVAMFEDIYRKIPLVQEGMREHIEAVNTYLWSRREHLTLIEKRGLFYLLAGPILEHCLIQIRRLDVWNNRYQAEFYAGATTHVVRAWIQNGFEESPHEITDIICELIKLDYMARPEGNVRS